MKCLKAVVTRISSLIHCIFIKILHPVAFNFCIEEIIASSTHFTIADKGKISIGKRCGMRRECEFTVSENGKIEIGNKCFFNKGCIIAAHERISIGDNTRFGPNVMVFDHDYDFRNSDTAKRNGHKSAPIKIGKNVWLGAGVIVLRGTTIGDNCVVGAGSILNGIYEADTLIVQKREELISEIRYEKV